MAESGCTTKEEGMYRDPMLAQALSENQRLEAENHRLATEKRILEERLSRLEGDTPPASAPAPKRSDWGQLWILVFAFVLLLGVGYFVSHPTGDGSY